MKVKRVYVCTCIWVTKIAPVSFELEFEQGNKYFFIIFEAKKDFFRIRMQADIQIVQLLHLNNGVGSIYRVSILPASA